MVVSLRGDERKVEQDSWSFQSSGDPSLNHRERAILDLIEQRRYTPAQVARVLRMSAGQVGRVWWRHWSRGGVQSSDSPGAAVLALLRDESLIPARDATAFELTKILDYTILEAADLLGVNRGHLSRVIRGVAAKLRQRLQAYCVGPPESESDCEAAYPIARCCRSQPAISLPMRVELADGWRRERVPSR